MERPSVRSGDSEQEAWGMVDLLMWPALGAVALAAVLTIVLGVTGQLKRYWWVAAVGLAVGVWTLALILLGVVPAHLLAEQWLGG